MLKDYLEVRGLGLLNIRTIFGETAARRKMKLKLIVHQKNVPGEDLPRLPLDSQSREILGIPVRKVCFHVAPGRNLAVLLEAAVRNCILQLRGIFAQASLSIASNRRFLTEISEMRNSHGSIHNPFKEIIMSHLIVLVAFSAGCLCRGSGKKAPSPAQLAQQEKMKACNAEAGKRNSKGDEHQKIHERVPGFKSGSGHAAGQDESL